MKKKVLKKTDQRKKIILGGEKTELNIVKRKGHTEIYDERKVYGSCFFACRNAHLSETESEWICSKVASAITKHMKNKKATSSDDIFRLMVDELKKYNEDASFLYETHRDLS